VVIIIISIIITVVLYNLEALPVQPRSNITVLRAESSKEGHREAEAERSKETQGEAKRAREKQREAERSKERHREAKRGRANQRDAERSKERQREAKRGRVKQRDAERSKQTLPLPAWRILMRRPILQCSQFQALFQPLFQ